ncbi:MAG: ParB/RepB/Spo0J family partition protein [Cellulomonas sp.]|uniref:ParB/RepB/Spo0J family partition protein n=1 Tax=Cellulomonas sp. TaxID=40001 RepID=UPI00258F8BE7|nr:ParB/RepB/Spo0J family partition protein [Cellulomonas sp.]MCR6706517.1 ParB/RepB/Spo0J family partition protein [Cellulomonas sp.]
MTTTTAKPRRGRASVPDVQAVASSSSALDALTLHPDQAGFRRTVLLAVEDLVPHPSNPRTDLGDLSELADSIRAHGVRQNLLVVPDPDDPARYRLVIGHRRTAAARLADVAHLPAVIDPSLTAADQLELMLLENLQRSDLTPVEEADGYQGLLDLGVDVATIAAHTGRSETTVRSRLRLVPLPDKARAAIHARDMTLEDAAALADLPESKQKSLVKALGTNNFRHQMATVRSELEQERQMAPLLKVLADANATELKPNEWATPEGSTRHMGDIRGSRAAEVTAELATVIGPGWSWRWYYGAVTLYRPHTLEEAQEAAETAARRTAQEAERDEANAKEAAERAVRTEFATVTATTRREFLEHLIHDRKALTKDQTATLLDYVATEAVEQPWAGTYWQGAFRDHSIPTDTDHADALVGWLRITLPDDHASSYHRQELLPIVAAAAADLTAPQRLLAALAAASEPIDQNTWRYGGRSVTTARWYRLLEQLGYVVSDAERDALIVPLDDDEPGEDD